MSFQDAMQLMTIKDRHRGEVAGGNPQGDGQGRGQQLVEDVTEREPGALAESLLARVS